MKKLFLLFCCCVSFHACGGGGTSEPSAFWHQPESGNWLVYKEIDQAPPGVDSEVLWAWDGKGRAPLQDEHVDVSKIISDTDFCNMKDAINNDHGANTITAPCDSSDNLFVSGTRYPTVWCFWRGTMGVHWWDTMQMLDHMLPENRNNITCSYIRHQDGITYKGGVFDFWYSSFNDQVQTADSCVITSPAEGFLIWDDDVRPGGQIITPAWVDSCGETGGGTTEFKSEWESFMPTGGGFGTLEVMREDGSCGDDVVWHRDYGWMWVGDWKTNNPSCS